MKTTSYNSSIPKIGKALLLPGLFCACTFSAAFAGEEILNISSEQDWKIVNSPETVLESDIGPDGMALKIEPASPPGITFVEAQVPWEWEVPKSGVIEVEIRGEIKKNCYFGIHLKTNEGKVFGTTFGESGVGFPLKVEGSAAQTPLASFKGKGGETLDAGSQIVGLSLIFAPDTANTITVSKISVLPESK